MSAETAAAERDSNLIIETQLDSRIETLESAADAHVVSYLGPMYEPADDEIKDAVEEVARTRRRPRQKSVLVFLETGGGLITVAERMANIFRHHYSRVDFLIPTYAMSAGTVLAMAGDDIYMDYASTLGPIDPQIRKRGAERLVPALGYLEQYEQLIKSQRKTFSPRPSWPTWLKTLTQPSCTSSSRTDCWTRTQVSIARRSKRCDSSCSSGGAKDTASLTNSTHPTRGDRSVSSRVGRPSSRVTRRISTQDKSRAAR